MPKIAKRGEALCPTCREPSSTDAVVCPNCQLTFTQAQIDARKQAGEYASSVQKGDKKWLTVGCLGLVAIVFIIALVSGSGEKSDKAPVAAAAAIKSDAKLDAIRIYKSVISTTADCDAASSKLAGALKAGEPVLAYRVADRAESVCLKVPGEIRAIEIPDSITGENRAAVESSIEACDHAYLMKWDAAKKFKAVIDGDTRPSALAELQETTEGIQGSQMVCGGGLVAVAVSLGATEADLGTDGIGKK